MQLAWGSRREGWGRRESEQGENKERQRRRKKWETEEERVNRGEREKNPNKLGQGPLDCISLSFRLRGKYRRIPLNLRKIGQGALNHWLSQV